MWRVCAERKYVPHQRRTGLIDSTMMNSEILLAKSVDRNAEVTFAATLLGHLQHVHAASDAVVAATGSAMLAAFGISTHKLPRFRRIVALAAAVHDVGKANDHFRGMLCGTADRAAYDYRQAVRHEWLSWWWLHLDNVREWAMSVLHERSDFDIVLCCVAGHHPAVHRPTPPDHIDGAGSKLSFLTGRADFSEITSWLNEVFPASKPLIPLPTEELRCSSVADNVVAQIHKQTLHIDTVIQNLAWVDVEPWQSFCACAKACLVAADVAGSALSEQSLGIDDQTKWISESLTVKPEPSDIEQLVRDRLGCNSERPFQLQVADSHARVTLVTAGCGSGKTVAAWLWAARQCPGQRIYFCYPTTGTATEGFRGYLFDDGVAQSKLGAKLFHSRASVDFDEILNARDDEDDDELKIASLRAWGTPVVCCTVDTVLGIMQNQRRGLYAWPALAQAAYVFDEIHAYDDKLFGCLLQFLHKLKGLRVLLMTASLPAARLQAIREVLADQDDELSVIHGASELEKLHRYHQLPADDVSQKVRDEVRGGGRVLWICNVVDRAMQVADQFAELKPLTYHSRFRYEDRIDQHRAVMEAFDPKSSATGCLAICTQVAEMSLDISATLMVSEICPVPSLIQRLGRLNRHAKPPKTGVPPPDTMPFIVVEPRKDDGDLQVMPYDLRTYGNWPERTRKWLTNIGTNAISQRLLANAWEQLGVDDKIPGLGDSTWIEGGPRTQVDSLRDSSSSVTVVMAGEDARRVADGKAELIRVAIPMPVPRHITAWKEWRRRGGYLVAPKGTVEYGKERGARWL